MLWFESRKQLSGGLINAFLSVLVVLQVETAKNLYVLWYECPKILKKYILFFFFFFESSWNHEYFGSLAK